MSEEQRELDPFEAEANEMPTATSIFPEGFGTSMVNAIRYRQYETLEKMFKDLVPEEVEAEA